MNLFSAAQAAIGLVSIFTFAIIGIVVLFLFLGSSRKDKREKKSKDDIDKFL
jgi:preprotein translocase subunit YajC